MKMILENLEIYINRLHKVIELTRQSYQAHKLISTTCNRVLQVVWDAAKRIKRESPLTIPEIKMFLKSEELEDPIAIRIYTKQTATEIYRDYMFSYSDCTLGNDHIYEIIKALYWFIWVQIDPDAVSFKPKYIQNEYMAAGELR